MSTEVKPKPQTFDSIRAAATGMKLPIRVLQAAKRAGCPAFRSNRVYEAELIAWMEVNPESVNAAGDDPRDEKLREEIRKLRIANDAKEARLIDRAWVAERIQRAAGELNSIRAKSESEDAMKFAETNGDVAECRTILRGIWDGVFSGVQSMAKYFEENAQ